MPSHDHRLSAQFTIALKSELCPSPLWSVCAYTVTPPLALFAKRNQVRINNVHRLQPSYGLLALMDTPRSMYLVRARLHVAVLESKSALLRFCCLFCGCLPA